MPSSHGDLHELSDCPAELYLAWGVIVLFILVYEGHANFQNCLIYMYIYNFGWIFSVVNCHHMKIMVRTDIQLA